MYLHRYIFLPLHLSLIYIVYIGDMTIMSTLLHDEAVMQDKAHPATCHDHNSFHHSAVSNRIPDTPLHCKHTRIIILPTQLKSIPVTMYFSPFSHFKHTHTCVQTHTHTHTLCQMSLALTVHREVEVLRQREWLIIQTGSLQSITSHALWSSLIYSTSSKSITLNDGTETEGKVRKHRDTSNKRL